MASPYLAPRKNQPGRRQDCNMKKLTVYLFIYSILICFNTESRAATGNSNANGNWSNPSTWLFAGVPRVPTCGDTVYIDAGEIVTVNSQIDLSACAQPLKIFIYGELDFTNGNKLSLPCGSVVYVMQGGVVRKITSGGGNSTLIEICSQVMWNAGMGDLTGPDTLFSGGPLPVSLIYFNAEPNGNKIDVNWTTASEINNDYFTVEKSADGSDFIPAATVDGAGNTTVMHNYFYPDYNPIHGVSYYRLKQTDFDGQFTYSPVVTVIYSDGHSFNIISAFTNGNTSLNVLFTDGRQEKCSVQLYNILGAMLFEEEISAIKGMNKKEFQIPGLKQGIYFVTLTNGTESQSVRFAMQ